MKQLLRNKQNQFGTCLSFPHCIRFEVGIGTAHFEVEGCGFDQSGICNGRC